MDRVDFAAALQPHYNDALRYCRALAARASHTEAEDVLQEALLKALRHYDQLNEPAKFNIKKPWGTSFTGLPTVLPTKRARR